jgi:hypothetical protein
LGRLHARDGATVTDLARSAELTARTVRARLADTPLERDFRTRWRFYESLR